jgi:hypothetical protein
VEEKRFVAGAGRAPFESIQRSKSVGGHVLDDRLPSSTRVSHEKRKWSVGLGGPNGEHTIEGLCPPPSSLVAGDALEA